MKARLPSRGKKNLAKHHEIASTQERALLHDQIDQKCFQHLHVTDPRDDKTRIQQTKGGLLQDSYQWILDNADFRKWREHEQSRIFWIKGDPGKGKTMLLCGIIDELNKPGAYGGNLSFFFCQATDDRINNATAVLRGLIFLLIDQQPALISHVRKKYDHAGQSLFQDRNSWAALSTIFTDILRDPQLNDTYLIVDALDECTNDRTHLLDFLIHESSVPSRIKWIVSSRNWPEIEERLELAKSKTNLCIELNAQSVSHAVDAYIEIKVRNLAKLKNYNIATSNAVQKHLLLNADNTFLWVALACEHLEKVPRYMALSCLKMFLPGLESFYASMAQHMRSPDRADGDLLEQILGVVTLVFRPLTVIELKALIDLPEDVSDDFDPLQDMIGRCGSFLTIREQTVYFIHQSAKDFLLRKCNPPIFSSGEAGMHHKIFQKSLDVMFVTLRRDMYGLRAPGIFIEQIQRPNPDPLGQARYSCVYWIEHLVKVSVCQSKMENFDDGSLNAIHLFLEMKFIHWLEALSLLRAMSDGVLAILQLEEFIQSQTLKPKTMGLLRDAQRFILHNRWSIENYPLQTYVSALIFSPTRSLIKQLYKRELPTWVRTSPRVDDDWSACLFEVGGHKDWVTSIAFSPDSKLVASGSLDETVKVWHAVTGQCIYILEAPNLIHSVDFSHDGKLLASKGSQTIEIWNVDSGTKSRTLKIYCDYSAYEFIGQSLAFSSDNESLIALASNPSLGVWDVASGKCLQKMLEPPAFTGKAALSQDGQKLASVYGTDAKIWDVESARCSRTFESSGIGSVWRCFFSPDGTCLAITYISFPNTVMVWNVKNGNCLLAVQSMVYVQTSLVVISHDNSRLALMDPTTGMSIWDMSSGDCLLDLKGRQSSIYDGQFSYDNSRFASGSSDGTVSFWDVSKLQRLAGGGAISARKNEIKKCSLDKMLIAWLDSNRKNIAIWDLAADQRLHTIESDGGIGIANFSSDGRLVGFSTLEGAIQIWDLLGGCQLLEDDYVRKTALEFSQDGCYLASGSSNGVIIIWEVANRDCLHCLQTHSQDNIPYICFSDNSRLIAAKTVVKSVKVWMVSTGELLWTFPTSLNYSETIVLEFSRNNERLVTESENGNLQVWNLLNGEYVFECRAGATYAAKSVAFSNNDKYLASASEFKTIAVWDANSGECLQEIRLEETACSLSFDTTCSYLFTSIGAFKLDLVAASAAVQNGEPAKRLDRHGYGFSTDGHWITHSSERLLWLPSGFRPTLASAVDGSTLFLGRVDKLGPLAFRFVDSEELPKHLGRGRVDSDKRFHGEGEGPK